MLGTEEAPAALSAALRIPVRNIKCTLIVLSLDSCKQQDGILAGVGVLEIHRGSSDVEFSGDQRRLAP